MSRGVDLFTGGIPCVRLASVGWPSERDAGHVVPVPPEDDEPALMLESGGFILLEDGGKILL